MKKQSAGILLYRLCNQKTEVFLVHPGGPFWKNKDAGAWTIPKGEFSEDENPLDAAKREFEEETGSLLTGTFIELQPVKQKGGKTVYAWAIKGEIDASTIRSNTFEIEWPPKSGKMSSFPEIDRADWFDITNAKEKINASQSDLIDQIQKITDLE